MTFNRAPGESSSPAHTPQPNISLLVLMRPGQGRGRGKSTGVILLVNSQPSSLSSLSPPSKYASCPQVPDLKKKKEALKTRIQGALPPSISARTRVSHHPRNLALHTYPKTQVRKEGRRGGSRYNASWVGTGLTQSASSSFSHARRGSAGSHSWLHIREDLVFSTSHSGRGPLVDRLQLIRISPFFTSFTSALLLDRIVSCPFV